MNTDTTTDQSLPPAESVRSGDFLRDVATSFRRWSLKAIRNPFIVAFSLFQPLLWLVLFTQVFQSIVQIPGFTADSYLAFFLPAVIIQLVLFSAASSGIGLVTDMESGMFEKTLVYPTSRAATFLGKTLTELARITLQVALIMALGYGMGVRVATGVAGVLAIFVVSMLFAGWFIALSNAIALWTQNSEATMIMTNFLSLPLLFMSSAFLPPELLPEWLQVVSALNPISYGIDAIRVLILDGWAWDVILTSALLLGFLDIALGIVAVFAIGRATSPTSS